MIILPAIDIQNGQCVRLYKGDFNTSEQVAADPLQTALSFQAAGAQWLHMVDLDGACQGKPVNQELFYQIAQQTNLKIELGGGIRDLETITKYFEMGIQRIVLGTAAIKNPQLIQSAVAQFGEKIAIGIDAKDEQVMVEGWLKAGDHHYLSLAKDMEALGVKYIIFTDISKDGTLKGPNLEQLKAINETVFCQIIASGGIHNLADIKDVQELGLYGAICGKAIYKGTLDLKEAIEIAATETEGFV